MKENQIKTLDELQKLSQGWSQSCRNKPMNMNSPMPAAWHLGVTLKSNDRDACSKNMKTALSTWEAEINRATLGEHSDENFGHHWCWVASYDPGSKSEQSTAQWHLIMAIGFDVKPGQARELLATARVDCRIGEKVLRGCRRTLKLEALFAAKWRGLMPNGSVVTTVIDHLAEEAAWINSMLNDDNGKLYTRLISAGVARDNILLGGKMWDNRTTLH
jgi:hypothetical protein